MKNFYPFFMLVLLNATLVFPQSWDQIIKAVASDRAASDGFGVSVSISGDYAIVGASFEDIDASNVDAGSAYIFVRSGETWIQQQKIVASDRAAGDRFGISVSISGDYAIVGAYKEDEDASGGITMSNAGSAYIFVRSSETWTQQQKIVASDRAISDYFGRSVSISGYYAIVGAFYEEGSAGSAHIFVRSDQTWSEQQKIVASDRGASDYFGISSSISGDYAVVGAYYEDQDASGGGITMSAAGSAYIFVRNGETWTQQQKIVASDRAIDDNFGVHVSISGDYVIVGAFFEDHDAPDGGIAMSNAGSAYIFVRSGETWTQQQKIVALDRAAGDNFGSVVSISGDYVIVGAFYEDEDAAGLNTAADAGSAYIFVRSGEAWTQQQKIVASDRTATDWFGAVSISGNYAIVGAQQEDHDAAGLNNATNAGSVYIFNNPAVPVPVELVFFNATISGNKITLNWKTATEVSNYGFEVERKLVNSDWTKIGFVQGHGNSNSPKSYFFMDNSPLSNTVNYRLKQIDFDGKYEYSPIVEVKVETPLNFVLTQNYPNPFNPTTKIEFSIPTDNRVQIKVYNVLGMKVATLLNKHRQAGMHSIEFNASNLASGIYFLKVVSGNYSDIKKMILLGSVESFV
ncbi:MAG: T9SS type A sorting domain-containing protein [Bacteroidetes bacterium]|nr:T9SS type A sorting domain-containing protein [Bacteroidota bacterium]MBU1800556.1 T9SS type A sorting domain-containing protein [Bacteroidota bacterium]